MSECVSACSYACLRTYVRTWLHAREGACMHENEFQKSTNNRGAT